MPARRTLALALVLEACAASGSAEPEPTAGGEASSSVEPERTGGGEALTRVRGDLVCTEAIPIGAGPTPEEECTARGCSWEPPLFCSGVAVPHEEIERFRSDPTRPCTCVCESDRLECMTRP